MRRSATPHLLATCFFGLTALAGCARDEESLGEGTRVCTVAECSDEAKDPAVCSNPVESASYVCQRTVENLCRWRTTCVPPRPVLTNTKGLCQTSATCRAGESCSTTRGVCRRDVPVSGAPVCFGDCEPEAPEACLTFEISGACRPVDSLRTEADEACRQRSMSFGKAELSWLCPPLNYRIVRFTCCFPPKAAAK